MDWYELTIESNIRSLVRLLRDNGFNTTWSCGHKHEVQLDWIPSGELERLDDLLFNANYRNYLLTVLIVRSEGHLRSFCELELHKDDSMPEEQTS